MTEQICAISLIANSESPSNLRPKKMQKSPSRNTVWTYPKAGVAINTAKQACMYEAGQQPFPAAAMRTPDVMTAAIRARIQHSNYEALESQ
jgi:hypothetical protein